MNTDRLLNIYIGFFLVFMFSPLLLMIVTSFNDMSPPSVTDWGGTTLKWYEFFWLSESELRQDPVLRVLDRYRFGMCLANGLLWWVLLSPMLAPGIVLGLSALIFWGELGVNAGLFTIMMAQLTFTAGYPLLIILARLQRLPVQLEEAARDLGASPLRTFYRITLPYLRPALVSAAVITFLASMENYNTTMFAKGGSCTFATEIGAMSRNPNGHPPVINAVGTIIILLTMTFAGLHAWLQKRKASAAQ
jgi:spermidine/putrescine transport system permease protein